MADTYFAGEFAEAAVGVGLGRLKGDGIQPPLSTPTSALGSAGAITGTSLVYTVAYRTALGVTSPCASSSAAISPSAQRVNLSNIPIGPVGVTARLLYRNKSASGTRDFYFLAEIPDNTTTVYVDNIADASLGATPTWSSGNTDQIGDGTRVIAYFSDQAVGFGKNTFATRVGYACTAFGAYSQQNLTRGLRNTSIGLYSLQNVTTGSNNSALGCHAGNGVTTGQSNTLLGYAAGGITGIGAGNFNTAVGFEALGANTLVGSGNTAFGFQAGAIASGSVSHNTSLGGFTGKYSTADFTLTIDACSDRGNLATAQGSGLIWGIAHQTQNYSQVLDINAKTRAGVKTTVTLLGTATAADLGRRAVVTDSSVAFSAANVGGAVVGGGAHTVPVICVTTGSGSTYAWAIG